MSSRHRWWPVAATVGAVALLAGIAVASSGWIRHEIRLSVTREPDRYTELSFTDPSTLPAALPVDTPVPVSFTIGNHEGKAVQYRYDVILSAAGESTVSQSGDATVADGRTLDVVVRVAAPRSRVRYTVTVQLPDFNESIHFHALSTRAPQR